MTTISKEFHFSAAHQLGGLRSDHPCATMHGHNYVLACFFMGKTDENGFVIDYRQLEKIKEYVDSTLDHKNLNEVFDFNCTVENMSKHLYWIIKKWFPQLSAVEMSETPKTRCRYEGH